MDSVITAELSQLTSYLTGKNKPVPKVTSYGSLYYAALENGKKMTKLRDVVESFMTSQRESLGAHPEYAWFLSKKTGESVDFDVVMVSVHNKFAEHLIAVRRLGERLRSEKKITGFQLAECLDFYQTYKLSDMFPQSTKDTRDIVMKMEQIRNKCREALLIELNDPTFEWCRVSYPGETWSAPQYSDLEEISLGERVVCSTEVAEARMAEFLSGVSMSDDTFPTANAFIAGGLVSKIVSANYEAENTFLSDIDIFIHGEKDVVRAASAKAVMEYMKSKFEHVWFSTFGSVCTVYVLNLKRIFQIVSCNDPHPMATTARFDLTHIQWTYENGKFYCTPGAYIAACTRVTAARNMRRWKPNRLIKAIVNGYSVEPFEDIGDFDIKRVLSDDDMFFKLAGESIGKMYFPTTISGKLTKTSLRMIDAQIRQLPNVAHVHTDVASTMETYTIGGDFNADYAGRSISNWNIKNIDLGALKARRYYDGYIRGVAGEMSLRTSEMTVAKFNLTDGDDKEDKQSIVTTVSDDIRKLLDNLKTYLAPLIVAGDNDKTNIVKDDKLTVYMSRGFAEYRERAGKPILKNQHGVGLNLREDLAVGDTVSFDVKIKMVRKENEIQFELWAMSVIKKTKYIETGANVCNVDNYEAEIERDVQARLKELDEFSSGSDISADVEEKNSVDDEDEVDDEVDDEEEVEDADEEDADEEAEEADEEAEEADEEDVAADDEDIVDDDEDVADDQYENFVI